MKAIADAGFDIEHVLQFEFLAPCTHNGCCECFSELANDLIDDDMVEGDLYIEDQDDSSHLLSARAFLDMIT